MINYLWTLANEYRVKMEELKPGSAKHTYHLGMYVGVIEAIEGMKGETCENVIKPIPVETKLDVLPRTPEFEVVPAKEAEKKLIIFKCEECDNVIAKKTDPEEPFLCQCENYHHFGDLYKSSYHCECGAKFHFWQEEDVDKINCRECGKVHNMYFDPTGSVFKSVEDVRHSV